MTAYTLVLALHNIMRWAVLIAGLMAASRALYALLGQRQWTSTDNRLGLIFMIAVDVQVLLGLILFFFLSPITREAFRDMGAAMAAPDIRFWSVEHVVAMGSVLLLAHLGRSLSRRAKEDGRRNMWASIFYTLAVVVMILGIPWFRPFFPSF